MSERRAVIITLVRGLSVAVGALALVTILGPVAIAHNLAGFSGRGPGVDFVQDYIGGRALLYGGDPYPWLHDAVPALGVAWHPDLHSTHPPTAFLLAMPVAWLPWPTACAIWMWAMVACTLVSLRLFGWPWRVILLVSPLLLLWPPAFCSFGQLTSIWLLALGLAWHWRAHPILSGAGIAIASMPKFFAVLSLGPFIRRGFWRACTSAILVIGSANAIGLVLHPEVLNRYAAVNSIEAIRQMMRPDNGALFVFAWRRAGIPGLTLTVAIALAVLRRGMDSSDDAYRWASWTWLSLALLPIAWVYSLLPLLPWLVHAVINGQWRSRALAGLALLAPLLTPMAGGGQPAFGVVLCLALSGAAFAAWPPRHSSSANRWRT